MTCYIIYTSHSKVSNLTKQDDVHCNVNASALILYQPPIPFTWSKTYFSLFEINRITHFNDSAFEKRSPGRQMRPMNAPADPEPHHRWSGGRLVNLPKKSSYFFSNKLALRRDHFGTDSFQVWGSHVDIGKRHSGISRTFLPYMKHWYSRLNVNQSDWPWIVTCLIIIFGSRFGIAAD